MGNIGKYARRHHVALLALFVALGGTSYAATNVLAPRNSVNSAAVINGALKTVDLSSQARVALKGNKGDTGPSGPQGPQGPQGTQGPVGPSTGPAGGSLAGNYPNPTIAADAVGPAQIAAGAVHASELGAITRVTAGPQAIAAGGFGSITATCPSGTTLLAGGFQPANFGVHATSSLPSGNGWEYQAVNTTGGASSLTVFALCLAA